MQNKREQSSHFNVYLDTSYTLESCISEVRFVIIKMGHTYVSICNNVFHRGQFTSHKLLKYDIMQIVKT